MAVEIDCSNFRIAIGRCGDVGTVRGEEASLCGMNVSLVNLRFNIPLEV